MLLEARLSGWRMGLETRAQDRFSLEQDEAGEGLCERSSRSLEFTRRDTSWYCCAAVDLFQVGWGLLDVTLIKV